MTTDKKSFVKITFGFWAAFAAIFGGIALFFWMVSKGYFGELPSFDELENPKSFLASEVYSSDNELLGKYYSQNRSNIKFEELPPPLG